MSLYPVILVVILQGGLKNQAFAKPEVPNSNSERLSVSAFEANIIKRLEENEIQIRKLSSRVEYLEHMDMIQKNEIQTTRKQLEAQVELTTKLEGMVQTLLNEKADRFDYNESQHSDFEEVFKEQHKVDIPNHRSVHSNHNKIRRAGYQMQVGFFATLNDHQWHVGANQPIVFDNVITNDGNAYNNHVGTFFAPVAGLYVFSTTLFSIHDASFHASFVRNGQALTTMYISGQEAHYDTSSQTVVLHLQAGDDVFIRNNDADRSIHGWSHSIFSGFLLQQD